MSKELIERLREAAASRVASTAMIGADDLIAAADALESLGADRDSWERQAGDRLDDVLRVVAERDALAAELKAVRGDQAPTVEDINLQEWKGMDGGCAWHLIDRYAEDWHHTERLMNAWLEANREELIAELKALREQEPVLVQHRTPIADMQGAIVGYSEWKDGSGLKWWPRRHLYARPVPARELTDAVDDLAQHIRQIDGNHSMGTGELAESIAEWADRYLKGEGK